MMLLFETCKPLLPVPALYVKASSPFNISWANKMVSPSFNKDFFLRDVVVVGSWFLWLIMARPRFSVSFSFQACLLFVKVWETLKGSFEQGEEGSRSHDVNGF